MEVPLSELLPFLDPARADTTSTPMVTRSGLIWPLAVGPREERSKIFPELSIAPTVITFSASPGITIDEGSGPEFPAATHMTSPFSTILLQASSSRVELSEGFSPPTEKETTSIP